MHSWLFASMTSDGRADINSVARRREDVEKDLLLLGFDVATFCLIACGALSVPFSSLFNTYYSM